MSFRTYAGTVGHSQCQLRDPHGRAAKGFASGDDFTLSLPKANIAWVGAEEQGCPRGVSSGDQTELRKNDDLPIHHVYGDRER